MGDGGEEKGRKRWGETKTEKRERVIVFEPGAWLFVFLMEPLPEGA